MSDRLRVFIGYDSKEPAAFAVATHSVMRHASRPVEIIPLVQYQLRKAGLYTRERGPTESTEFSLTRFLVPYLSNFEGVSLFLDCDVLVRADVYDLLLYPLIAPDQAVHVAQHDYTPKDGTKFLGHVQTVYPRKNWSSVMLFQNAECRAVTPEYVNTATGLDLHRFHWIRDAQIGALPRDWNWLIGDYPPNAQAKILHYTLGGPWWAEHVNCDHADLWRNELALMMGSNVHAVSR